MLISDYIAQMLEEMLSENGGSLEIRRNDLAEKVGCVPSQINYVITSRFTPEKGYITESRRGGGGYVRIVKKEVHKDTYLMNFYYAIGDCLKLDEANAFLINLESIGLISSREHQLLYASMTPCDAETRAQMLKRITLFLMK